MTQQQVKSDCAQVWLYLWNDTVRVSASGRVEYKCYRKFKGERREVWRAPKIHLDDDAYPRLNLPRRSEDGNGRGHRLWRVHILVALAFLGPCPEGMEVNHKDLNKQNPRWSNLEYTTHKKNMKHAVLNDVKFGQAGEQNGKAKLTRRKAKRIRKKFHSGKYSLQKLSKKYKVSQRQIWLVITDRYTKFADESTES